MAKKKLLNQYELKKLYYNVINNVGFHDKPLSEAYQNSKEWLNKTDSLPIDNIDKEVIESILINRLDKMEKIKIDFLFGTTDTGRVNETKKIIKNNPYLKPKKGEYIQLVELGNAMKKKKEKLKITLKTMGEQIGMDGPTCHRYMKGEIPNIKNFIKICKWLELEPGTVLNLLFETE